VKTGISDDNFIEIVSGLSGDEKVISGPYRAISKDLEDKSKIRVPSDEKGKDKKSEKEQKADTTKS
jgi:HlyD family secretion protein